MGPYGKPFLSCLLACPIGVTRICKKSGARDDTELETLEDAMRTLGIDAEIIRVDDESAQDYFAQKLYGVIV